MSLTARTILITGASRGLGLELVKQILEMPTAPEVLIAACREPTKATNLQNFAKSNPALKIIKLDIEKDEDIDSAFQETKKAVGDLGLNLLINNAGIYMNKEDGGGLDKQTRERMQRHFDVHVSGPIILVQKFLPLIQQAAAREKSKSLSFNRAGVVIISSIMGSQTLTCSQGVGTPLDYKCSKSAATMAGILLSRELQDSGILVASLHPGWVKTEMGGPNADLNTEDSIRGCLSVIAQAGKESAGKMLSYKGEVLPF